MKLGNNKRTQIEVGLFERLYTYQHYIIENYYKIYQTMMFETHNISPINITSEVKILHLYDNRKIY